VKWHDSAISEALATNKAATTTNPSVFWEALVGALGSLKETMDTIVLKEPATNKQFTRLPD
jgi:hypothetical protein